MLCRPFVGSFNLGKHTHLNLEAPVEKGQICFKEIAESHKTRPVFYFSCGSHIFRSHSIYFLKVLCI